MADRTMREILDELVAQRRITHETADEIARAPRLRVDRREAFTYLALAIMTVGLIRLVVALFHEASKVAIASALYVACAGTAYVAYRWGRSKGWRLRASELVELLSLGSFVAAGALLLANRFVPLALIAAFPISVNVFLVDWFLAQRLRAEVMGTGALLMNAALIMAYLEYYRPLLQSKSSADGSVSRPTIGFADNALTRLVVQCRPVVLGLATINGFVMLVWVAVMIAERQMQ